MEQRVYFSNSEVRKNITKSIILIIIMMALVFGLSYFVGYLLGDIASGITLGVIISLIVIPIQLLTSRIAILAMTRGRKANMNNPKEARAKHLVEGLAVAAGLGNTPDLYIIPSRVPNAFASGLSKNSSFIGVTQGLLELMSDQELEGVLAHEMSHIMHRDVLLQQLVVSLVSVLLMLALIAERIAWFGGAGKSRNRDERDQLGFVFIVILFAILIRPIAYLIGNIIQLAISRKREYAADAYAVRLCGYNNGLANALRKLDNQPPLSSNEMKSLGGKQMSAMYISFPERVSSLFSTHPPLKERIKKIDNMY